MGKIKTVIMGNEKAEEAARKKAEAKREQKKAEKTESKNEKAAEKSKEARHSGEELATTPESLIVQNESDSGHLPAEASAQAGARMTKKSKKTKFDKLDKLDKLDKYKFPAGKKYAAAVSLVDKSKTYSLSDAISLVKKTSFSKFDGSVELHINVTEKGLRGSVALPHGTGKQIRVAIATDELINQLTNSPINFDILVASPDMMPKLARVAKILGPKGLMPNPKTGTIGPNPEELAKKISGSASWRTQNDFPIIHAVIGKVSFEDKKLEENYSALIKSIGKDKIKSLFIKPTMGPSLKLGL